MPMGRCVRALAAGHLLVDQASVIVRAVDALPEDAEAWVAPKAQQWLLDQAKDHDAKTLRILGKRILEVIDPAAADAHEAKLLEKEEQAAEAAAMFRMHDDGHGRCHGKFTISCRHGAMLKKALLAKAAPKHRTAVDGHAPEPGQPTAHRMGLAFQEYLETYPADALPKAGGVNATVVVTMTLETLLGGLKAAQLDTGEKITAGRSPPDGLPSRDHPGRPRREVEGPRPRPHTPLPLRDPTHRRHHRPRRLHRRGLRLATRHVPSAPPHALEQRRRNQPRRHTPLPPTPHPRPRPPLRTTHQPNGKISFHPRR